MANLEAEALKYIGLIYDAALDHGEWPRLLQSLAEAVNGHSALLRRMDTGTREIGFFVTTGYDAQYCRAYREHFFRLDPYQAFFDRAVVGDLRLADEVVEPRQRRDGEYFNDYELPQDKVHNLGGVLHRDTAGNNIQFAIQRGRRQGVYSPRERQLITLLAPHLARAVRMHSRLLAADYHQNLALTALDALRLCVFLLDADGRLFFANRAAETLLAEKRLVVLPRGIGLGPGLAWANVAGVARWLCLLEAARGGHGVAGEMGCPDGDGGWWHLWASPLERLPLPDELGAVAGGTAVFVSRPGPVRLPWKRVAGHYGLTPAEARLAAALADGTSLEAVADKLGIAYGTARIQLKRVFAKTGVNRQSALVAVLLQSVLASCRSEP